MKFNVTVIYIAEVQAKCIKMGWHIGTQQIINFTNATGSTINVIHQYGRIDAPCSKPNAKLSARALEHYFRQEQGKTI
jgi:hypothetical protein